jgi:hypothetical protein
MLPFAVWGSCCYGRTRRQSVEPQFSAFQPPIGLLAKVAMAAQARLFKVPDRREVQQPPDIIERHRAYCAGVCRLGL